MFISCEQKVKCNAISQILRILLIFPVAIIIVQQDSYNLFCGLNIMIYGSFAVTTNPLIKLIDILLKNISVCLNFR